MMDARLWVGNYAGSPYCFEGLNLNVYCVEELCYVLKENAFLLDVELMSDRLVDWIRLECGLCDLAEELYQMVHKKGSFSAFVARILEYTGFYEEEVLEKTVKTLKQGAGLNRLEKRKLQIDGLLEQRRFLTAIKEYEILLSGFHEAAKTEGSSVSYAAELHAALLHNKGVALVGLMRYQEAAGCFREAYETDSGAESLKCYLAAKRMELKDQDYVAFVSGVPELAQSVLSLEQEIETLNKQWEQEADYLRLLERSKMRGEDESNYRKDNHRILQGLKCDYRGMTG